MRFELPAFLRTPKPVWRPLGRTGIQVTMPGFGLGGHSRAGLGQGIDHLTRVLKTAWNAGIRTFDTAESYGNDTALGDFLNTRPKNAAVLSTKVGPDGLSPADLEERIAASLQRLKRDHLDIFYLHGVLPEAYPAVRAHLLPVLQEQKRAGRLRAIGLTERFLQDPGHAMLGQALCDSGAWDVFMIGHHLLNTTATRKIFPEARRQGIGLVGMFAVRNLYRDPRLLRQRLEEQVAQGRLPAATLRIPAVAALLAQDAEGLMARAYAFCREEPALDTVLFGSSNPDHVKQTARWFRDQRMDPEERSQLEQAFAGLDGETSE